MSGRGAGPACDNDPDEHGDAASPREADVRLREENAGGLSLLYVPDVAKILRLSHSATREWLACLERRFEGDGVVRIGRKLAITESTLRVVLRGGTPEASLRRRCDAHDQCLRRHRKRLRAIETALAGRLTENHES
jgi:hypothetical protein